MGSTDENRSRIQEFLIHLSEEKIEIHRNTRNPSYDAEKTSMFGADFRKKTKVRAVTKSFDRKQIKLKDDIETTEGEQIRCLRIRGKKGKNPSPQKQGTAIHNALKKQIQDGTREGREGQLLNQLETTFDCKFLQAEVGISGYSVRNTAQQDPEQEENYFWSGKIDAVAFRQRSPNDDPEVFVVDWKTSSETDTAYMGTWWNSAKNFKPGLYQCLVYRALLEKRLKDEGIEARVGIMLVPIHQFYPDFHPGLCTDFSEMREAGLLQKLEPEECQWFAERPISTITLPSSKLFKQDLKLEECCVTDDGNILKNDTCLKDILHEKATVEDLCRELGLIRIGLEIGEVGSEEGPSVGETPTSSQLSAHTSASSRSSSKTVQRKLFK